MKKILMASLFLFSIITFAYNANSFPKKSKSLIQDKIIGAEAKITQEEIQKSGYMNEWLKYCNYSKVKDEKEFLKNLKGLVGYVNWDLFKAFNDGSSILESQRWVAGEGWGDNDLWTQTDINFNHNLVGCHHENSIKRALKNNLNIWQNILLPFIKDNSKGNYLDQIEILKQKLNSDKRDNYSIFISLLSQTNTSSKIDNNNDNIEKDLEKNEEKSADKIKSSNTDNEDEFTKLKKLKLLFEMELISEEEYELKKKNILDNM